MDGTAVIRPEGPLSALARRYREAFALPGFALSAALAGLFFIGSVAVSYLAITYATERASNPVTDIILSNVPAFDLDGFFLWGTIALIIFIALVLLARPRRMPFALCAMAFFYVIRSVFTSLTHIGPYPTQIPSGVGADSFLGHFLFGGDLFFSGHVGLSFLMALIFWNEKTLRYIFLAGSGYMSVVVLLGHYHYSIDVASAFFITYTIYVLARNVFAADYAVFAGGERGA